MASLYFLLILLLNLFYASSDDVLGCNGFIKSDLNIDLSKVYVKLFTKQGNLKDQTECSPNGYYFLPIYDSGDYIIRVHTESGWSFDPPQVSISVDGINDPCSLGKDINFVFTGFAISGQVVSSGFDIGPKGITVELFETSEPNKPKLIGSQLTGNRGSFHISPVNPGNYLVKASHPKWKLNKSEAKVIVKESNGDLPKNSLTVAGYDVVGSVTSDNQPISGVSFLLFAKSKVQVQDCDVTPLDGVSTSGWLCHMTSDSKGIFTFPSLPPGTYSLVPHYKGAGAKFNILPTKLDFTLSHESLVLPTVFQVQGFTVVGKVLWSEGGKPMENVKVFMKGSQVATTNSQGIYTLDGMRASTYRIQFKAEGVLFNEADVKVSGTQLADIIPSRYKISGRLIIQDSTKTDSQIQRHVRINGPNGVTQQVTLDGQGSYSAYLAPGLYSLSILSLETDKTSSLQFSPAERKIEVKQSIIENIDFYQLKCTVRGKIICMKTPCPAITVKLKPIGSGTTLQTVAKVPDGTYMFTDVLPGDYDLFVEGAANWCWDKETVAITVSSENTEAPTFTQSGFILSIVSSHTTKVLYKADVGDSHGEILCGVGGTQACVPTAHTYSITPIGCHGFKEKVYRWSAGSPPVKLLALTHGYTFSVAIPKGAKHPHVFITRLQNQNQTPVQLNAEKVLDDKDIQRLVYTVQLAEGDKLDVSPSSSLLLFTPKTVQITGDNDCTDSSAQPLFIAEMGHTLKGRVVSGNSTGLGGVKITISDDQGLVVSTLETSADGYYTSPPIRKLPSYKIVAEREGYVLTGPESSGNFYAHKLAEIIVKVVDSRDNKPLQGVLLSLSGGESYRKNAHTGEDGVLTFHSLSPAQYFLRPMMKEYKFSPTSLTIKVSEGQTQTVVLKGVRVAYSAFGSVLSLNRDGEPGIVVEAVGIGNCNLYQEEATSGSNGHFRIRGLQSGCEYNVKVKQGPDVNQHIFKSSPESITVKVNNADVKELQLYAFRSLGKTDIVVYVTVDRPEDLKTLRVKVTREDSPDHVVSSARLSDYKPTSGYSVNGAIVAISSVPSDSSFYLISLESNLARSTHDYALRPVRIIADSPLRIARLNFAPTLKQRDPEPTSSSYLALPLVIIAFIVIYHRTYISNLISSISLEESSQAYQDKKKAKLRKVQ